MDNYQTLENRGVIKVSGLDSRLFLQGLITNDINKASCDKLTYAMMLSPQGRFLTDFFILKNGDGYLLDSARFNLLDIVNRLNNYRLRAKVEISDISSECKVLASSQKLDNFFLQDPRNEAMGYRKIATDFEQVNGRSFDEYEKTRIKLKIPDAEADFIYDKSFPLEFGAVELNAIDFLKGCYVGQEVTARTYHIGVIRKKLMNLEIQPQSLPLLKGTEITANSQKIGIVLGTNNCLGLALVKMDDYNAHSNQKLFADNIPIKLY